VEAPISIAVFPEIETSKNLRARSNLRPPLPTNGCSGSKTLMQLSSGTILPALLTTSPSTLTFPARIKLRAFSPVEISFFLPAIDQGVTG